MDRRWHILLFLACLIVPLGLFTLLVLARTGELNLVPLARAPQVPSTSTAEAAPRRDLAEKKARLTFSAGDENRLLDLARSGEACALLESPLTARAPLATLFRLFPNADTGLPADALDAYLRALSARSPAEFETALRAVSHPLLDLTLAAAEMGLLPGYVRLDPRAALPTLRALAESDSLNAAPSLYLAYALQQLGETGESSEELARALERPIFRTYTDEALRSIYQRARGRPTLLSAAVAIGARAPNVNLFPVEDFLLDSLTDADPAFAELAYGFGRRLEAQDDTINAFNFGLGRRIAATAWKKLHPSQRLPRPLSDRPVPAGQRAPLGLLAGLQLPLQRGACEKELPRLAERLEAAKSGRAPALQ